MQPYSDAFAAQELTPPTGETAIGDRKYRAAIAAGQGYVGEQGPRGEHRYPIVHVMGGKNVYYFLTSLDRGRLQVLPVAYDVRSRAWYDTAASGVRHFSDRHLPERHPAHPQEEPLDWGDRLFTFNTTCLSCHVSQLATNYDLKSDSYHTTWGEPGISCESCHGPGGKHVKAMEAAGAQPPHDIQIIRTKAFSAEQMNDMCATCHAKLSPLSHSFVAGDKFWDHYDLVTLEHPDFYADGRDLGENYTYTSWLMSPCQATGKLDCNHCHTASGRLRFAEGERNQACMPCHAQQVNDPAWHGHHAAGSPGNDCVACHMPMTRFAAMGRSDHSMRPPTPATTLAYQSPNACNLCHSDQDAAWADQWVRKWYPRDYQAEPLRQAALIDAARKSQWERLPEMLSDIAPNKRNTVHRNSLVRLLAGCDDPRKWPALKRALQDAAPLVRASAVSGFAGRVSEETIPLLVAAAGDPSRLVRVRAAAVLAAAPPEMLGGAAQVQSVKKATAEFQQAMRARPDDWASHANLGNFHLEQGDFAAAVAEFQTAERLEPRMIGPLVNAAIAYSNLGKNEQAEQCLRRALKLEPQNAAVQFNLGLLLGERGEKDAAQKAFRAALEADPQMAAAAYNLGVLLAAQKELPEAIAWCRKAYELRPDMPKYAQSLAYYLQLNGDAGQAIEVLRQALAEPALAAAARSELQAALRALEAASKPPARGER